MVFNIYQQVLDQLLDYIDGDNDGMISVGEFIQYLRMYEIEIREDEVEELHFLANEKGEISKPTLKKFVKISWIWDDFPDKVEMIKSDVNQAKTAFKSMDSNKDESVTEKEFSKTLKKLKPEHTEVIFKKYDEDGDGKLSFDEFKMFMNARKFKKQQAPTYLRRKLDHRYQAHYNPGTMVKSKRKEKKSAPII